MSETKSQPTPDWQPFPNDVLPPALRDLAIEGAAALGIDPAAIALPGLALAAGAIGIARETTCKGGDWREPSILWSALVMPSGSRKSPALDLVAAPAREIEAKARREHKRAMRDYHDAYKTYERDLSTWKRDGAGPPPEEPVEPTCARMVVQDATLEAQARVVEAPPHSLVVVADELGVWFGSRGRYREGGAAAETASWCALYGGRPLSVDRASKAPIYVESCAVSVAGCLTPGGLARAAGETETEGGLLARVLLAMPPPCEEGWTTVRVSTSAREAWACVIRALRRLRPMEEMNSDGETTLRPMPLPLTPEAEMVMASWVGEVTALRHAVQHGQPALAAALSKLEGAALRLGGVVELANAEAPGEVRWVEVAAMRSGVALARWLAAEVARVYAVLGINGAAPVRETTVEREARGLVTWVEDHPGATAREARALKRFDGSSEAAAKALDNLAADGRIERRPGARTVYYFPLTATATASCRSGSVEADSGSGSTDTHPFGPPPSEYDPFPSPASEPRLRGVL